jgi:hypothetical protein
MKKTGLGERRVRAARAAVREAYVEFLYKISRAAIGKPRGLQMRLGLMGDPASLPDLRIVCVATV